MNTLELELAKKTLVKSIENVTNNTASLKDFDSVAGNLCVVVKNMVDLYAIEPNFNPQRVNSLVLTVAKLDVIKNVLNESNAKYMAKSHSDDYGLTQFLCYLLLATMPIKTDKKFKKNSKTLLDFSKFSINDVDSIKFFEWDKTRLDKKLVDVDHAAAAFQLFTANIVSSNSFVENGYTFVDVSKCGFISKIEISLDKVNWFDVIDKSQPTAIKNPDDTTQYTIYFRVPNGLGGVFENEKVLDLVEDKTERAAKEAAKLRVKIGKNQFTTLPTLTVDSIAEKTEASKKEKDALLEKANSELNKWNQMFNQQIALDIEAIATSKDTMAIEQRISLAFMAKVQEQMILPQNNDNAKANDNDNVSVSVEVIDTGLEQQQAV